MTAIKTSVKTGRIWRWLRDETGKQLPDKLSPLTQPFKSSSPQPAVWEFTWYITCSSRRLRTSSRQWQWLLWQRLFPVIKLSLPRCCVKCHLHCQLGYRRRILWPSLARLVVAVTWPVESFMYASINSEELVRPELLTMHVISLSVQLSFRGSSAVCIYTGLERWLMVIVWQEENHFFLSFCARVCHRNSDYNNTVLL